MGKHRGQTIFYNVHEEIGDPPNIKHIPRNNETGGRERISQKSYKSG